MSYSAFKKLGHEFESIIFHHLFERPMPDASEAQEKADLYSFIVAHCDTCCFSYGFLNELLKRRAALGFRPIPAPTLLEYLELLEFREAEQIRILSGDDPHWKWMPHWGAKPSWNSHVHPSTEQLQATQRGILVHKALLGHGSLIPIDEWGLWCISNLHSIFLKNRNFRHASHPIVPPVYASYDLSQRISNVANDNQQHWDVDGVLGDYRQGRVTLYPRALSRCSAEIGIPYRDLFLIVLIHEVAHYYLHKLPDEAQGGWASEGYEKTSRDVHEGLAQLFTYWVFNGGRDHHSRSFELLNAHQSQSYRAFQNILSVCEERDAIIDSIVKLRSLDGATFDDWVCMIRQ